MAKSIPFDEDTMTLIMGLGGPEKPGQHGRTMVPAPEQKAIDLVTEIHEAIAALDKAKNILMDLIGGDGL